MEKFSAFIFLVIQFLNASAFLTRNVLIPDGNAKIVGGEPIPIQEAPFIVTLMYRNNHLCGGSIISNSWILTAAHCTEIVKPTRKISDLSISVGSSMVQKSEDDTYHVMAVYDHPLYSNETYDHDFSLIKIWGKIFYNDQRRAIKLPEANDVISDGTPVMVFGWGLTMNSLESSDYLRAVEVVTINSHACEKSYKQFLTKITKFMVCAGHDVDGKDSCQGK